MEHPICQPSVCSIARRFMRFIEIRQKLMAYQLVPDRIPKIGFSGIRVLKASFCKVIFGIISWFFNVSQLWQTVHLPLKTLRPGFWVPDLVNNTNTTGLLLWLWLRSVITWLMAWLYQSFHVKVWVAKNSIRILDRHIIKLEKMRRPQEQWLYILLCAGYPVSTGCSIRIGTF